MGSRKGCWTTSGRWRSRIEIMVNLLGKRGSFGAPFLFGGAGELM
jgi:hypothetical protein